MMAADLLTAIGLGALGVAAGTVLGLAFFGGLWATSARVVTADRPAVLLVVSFVGRLALLSLVLVVLARLDAALLLGAAAGLVLVRAALIRTVRAREVG